MKEVHHNTELYVNYEIPKRASRLGSMVKDQLDCRVKAKLGRDEHADTVSVNKQGPILKAKESRMSTVMKESLKADKEMAIIGLWKEENHIQRCYRHFYVPCPLTREVRSSVRVEYGKDSTVACQ